MSNWLKFLCTFLLLYVVVFSFYHPLSPGILGIDKEQLAVGNNVVNVTGYNTHFLSERNSLKAFLECDSTFFCAGIAEVTDETHLRLEIFLDDTLRFLRSNGSTDSTVARFALFINNNADGTIKFAAPPPVVVGVTTLTNTNGAQNCTVVVNNKQHTSFGFPFDNTELFETIRNLMFHVPMWFTMFLLMTISFIASLAYMRNTNEPALMIKYDMRASVSAAVGMTFCLLGLLTGSVWARFTWLHWWTSDPQLNGALVVFIAYSAYFILRSTVSDAGKRARLSAVYNIFAFVMMIILLFVIPRIKDSVHPGKEGSPAFSKYDIDSSLRTVFYPAVLGWGLLGYWLYTIRLRLKRLEHKTSENDK